MRTHTMRWVLRSFLQRTGVALVRAWQLRGEVNTAWARGPATELPGERLRLEAKEGEATAQSQSEDTTEAATQIAQRAASAKA